MEYQNRNPIAIARIPTFMDGGVTMASFFEEALDVVTEELTEELTDEAAEEALEMAAEADTVDEPPAVLLEPTVISKTPEDMSLLSKLDDEV